MTGFQGADPRDLQTLAGLFGRAAGITEQAAGRLGHLTRSGWPISGPAGDDLRNSLTAVCQGLSSCVERVGPLSVELREEAEQQIRASAASGASGTTRAATLAAAAPALTPLVFRPEQAAEVAELIQVAERTRTATSRSLSCIEGTCLPGVGAWLTDAEFNGRMPPAVQALERQAIRQLYGSSGDITDLASMQAHPDYHAYMNVTAIPKGLDAERLWHEYRRSPAPALTGPHEEPVRSGDSTYDVFWFGSVNPDNPVKTPWPGGVVRHLVDDEHRIVANVTAPLHGLYPGYIIRWIDKVDGPDGEPIYLSWTIGRGTGHLGNTNMYVGSRLFHELDQQIGKRARR